MAILAHFEGCAFYPLAVGLIENSPSHQNFWLTHDGIMVFHGATFEFIRSLPCCYVTWLMHQLDGENKKSISSRLLKILLRHGTDLFGQAQPAASDARRSLVPLPVEDFLTPVLGAAAHTPTLHSLFCSRQ